MHAFIEKHETINNQTMQTLNELKDTFAKFTSALTIRRKVTYESLVKSQASSMGIFNLKEDHDLSVKYLSLVRKVETLDIKKTEHVKTI